MSKALDSLKAMCETCHRNIQAQPSKGMLPHKECPWRHISNDYCDEYELVRKNLMVIEILQKKAIGLFIPDSDFSNEHYDLKLYINTLTKEERALIEEVLFHE